MSKHSTKAVIVIPTRNRAGLAENAIMSVINQGRDDVAVLVSDNSTDSAEFERLSAFCARLKGSDVHYARPSPQLAMCAHWQWALMQAFQLPGISHFAYLTDRTVFKPGRLGALLDYCARFPETVISYHQDVINDIATPIKVEQAHWTGSLFRLKSTDLLTATSRMQYRFYDCLPRMLNSIAPRAVLDAIIDRYGDVFVSTAPDLCFTYRFLERFDSLLYLDQPLMTQYALHRSNGMSQALGKLTKDYKDFMANVDGEVINFAAPIPGLNTNMNTVLHEYSLVKRLTQSAKFPDIDGHNYAGYLTEEVSWMEESPIKRHNEGLLAMYREKLSPSTQNVTHDWFGTRSQVSEHESLEAAMDYASSKPRRRGWDASNEETMMDPELVIGAQATPMVYLRFFFVRSRKSRARFRRAIRQAMDRHILWRFRSA